MPVNDSQDQGATRDLDLEIGELETAVPATRESAARTCHGIYCVVEI